MGRLPSAPEAGAGNPESVGVSVARLEDGRTTPPPRATSGARGSAPASGAWDESSLGLFHHLAETSRDVVYRLRVSPTPGFEYVSSSVFALTGYTADELYADRDLGLALVHPEDRPRLDAVLAGHPAPDPFVLRWQRRDGEPVWVELRLSPFTEPDGATGFDGVARDVTTHRKAVVALWAAQQEVTHLAAIIASADEAIIGEALDGTVTSWNAAAERLFGYAAAEMIGESVLRLVPPAEASNVLRIVEHLATGGHVEPFEGIRLAKGGTPVDVSLSVSPTRNAAGDLTGIALFAHDIGERKRAEKELSASEARFRALAENIPTGLAVLNADMTIGYVNPACATLFGDTLEEVASLDSWLTRAFPDPADRAAVVGDWPEAGTAPSRDGVAPPWVSEHRITCGDGAVRSALVTSQPIGDVLYLAFTDLTDLRVAEERRRESEERYRTAFEGLAEGVLLLDARGAIVGSNANARRILGFEDDELLGRTWSDPSWMIVGEDGRPYERPASPESVGPRPGEAPGAIVIGVLVASGERRWLRASLVPLPGGSAGTPASFALSFADVTESRRTRGERDRLVAVVEQATDAIGIADAAGTLVYANAALGALAGRPIAEMVGGPALAIMGGRAVDADGLWKRLRDGHIVSKGFAARRPDGSTFRAEGTIAPLREDGAINHFIFVARDVTRAHEIEDDLTLEGRVRAALAEALLESRPTDTLEGAIQLICDRLASIPGIDYAGVEAFEGEDGVAVLASHVPAGFELGRGVAIPPTHAAYVRDRVKAGPWAEYWEALPEDGVFNTLMEDMGLKAMAIGPITHEDHIDGLLVIGTRQDEFARTLVERRPALVASSTATSALLAERLHTRRLEVELHRSISEVIGARLFHPVFQPIVDLASGEVIGYEALTRFDSGRRPDLAFADAWSVALGRELELATLELATVEARALPAGRWLNLNASARLLPEHERLREIFASADRPIAIEITEHEAIADYRVVRDAVQALGHDLRLAVDDAGAGVANFTHIIELRPDFVKLDISLVRRVNADPGRQALVVAMRHFSRTTGCRLIAEGIETEEEARTLQELGVGLGQGYWFGRPDRAEAWASPQSAD